MRLSIVMGVWLGVAAAALGDSVELKDGRVIKGRIVGESEFSVTVELADSRREVFSKQKIKKIVREESSDKPALPSAADGATAMPADATNALTASLDRSFIGLAEADRQIRNARADFDLARYQKVLERLKPSAGQSASAEQKSTIQWLIIESHLRLAEFERVLELCRKLQDEGTPSDKARAKAYLDLLDSNAKDGYGLRQVNDEYAWHFLKEAFYSDEFIDAAKEPRAFAKPEVMRVALEQYCYQILLRDKGVEVFKKSLDLDETLKALRDMPKTGAAEKYLPFVKDKRLDRVVDSINSVDWILPGFAVSYRLDLVRIEAEHLYQPLERLFEEVIQKFPPGVLPPTDANGNLTGEGRKQWRKRCEDYARDLMPLIQLARYIKVKVDAYPRELRRLIGNYKEIIERLEGARNDALRKKEITRV